MAPQGAVGGTINIVPKRATDDPVTDVTPMYLSNGQVGGAVDIGRRFGANNEFGVRFNGVYHDGNTAIDHNSEQLGLGVLGLDYQGDRVRLSIDLGHQEDDNDGLQRPLFVLTPIPLPAPPDPSKSFLPSWYKYDNVDTFGLARGEFDISDRWTIYGAIGSRRYDGKGIYQSPTLTNSSTGAFTATTIAQAMYDQTLSGMAGLRGKFDTGPVNHAVNFNYTNLIEDNGRLNSPTTFSFVSNIYSPTTFANPNLPIPSSAPKTASTDFASYAVSDTASILQDRIQLTFGEREQQVGAKNFNATTGAVTSNYSASALSPFAGLVLKPLENVSLYGNYIQGLQQGAIAPATVSNAGQVFPPYQTEQYEAGVKIDWGKLTTTADVFQISQPSAYIDGATNTYVVNGETRNRGVELNVFGQLTDSIRVLGGIAFNDAVLVKTAGGTFDGKTAPSVPKINLVIGGEWDTPFLPGLTLTGRVNHQASQYYDNANTQSIPGFTTLGIGARYTLERPGAKPIVIRANIENVLNNRYWQTAGAPGLVIGQPRTYLISTTFSF